MTTLPIYVVDAFIVDGKPFTGNPAAVCILEYDDDITDCRKQEIAEEMNLSETAFVSLGWTKGHRLTSPESNANLLRRTIRWFTRTTEVPLCGHATVASTKAISAFLGTSKPISFESKCRGELGAIIEKDGSITINFPSNPTHALNEDPAVNSWVMAITKKTLGAVGGREIVQDLQYSPGTKVLFIRLKDDLGPEGLTKVKPDFPGLLAIDTGDFVVDVIVTVKGGGSGKGPDFYSRFFAPWDGTDEDPVTGLAHTVLTPYWGKELGTDGPLRARQHSRRGGDLVCTLLGDRVNISGQARIGLKGELFL